MDYMGSDLNNGRKDLQPNVESCISFCRTNYPKAIYFTWVDVVHARKEFHDSCWCKNANAINRRTEAQGITSGALSCRGKSSCSTEEDIHYPGSDINNGNKDPKQYDARSCASFCKTNHPEASYFTWVSDSWSKNEASHNTCWCKSEDAVNRRRSEEGLTSGPLFCQELHLKNVTACENTDVSLECPAGLVISIEFANYGRYAGPDVCPHSTITREEYECEADSSFDEVAKRCDYKESCQVQASNHVFGDPCGGTYKYLEVQFQCVIPDDDYYDDTADCQPEENMDYMGSDLNNGRKDLQPNVESCISFCRTNYPKAIYFTWVDVVHARKEFHNSCWCKNVNAINHRTEAQGITSGAINCRGKSSCSTEKDVHYPGSDINNGNKDPKQYDDRSCASYCKTNYPEASYFTWVSDSWSKNEASHNTCWCKRADAISRRTVEEGLTSGSLFCQDPNIITANACENSDIRCIINYIEFKYC